MWARRIVSGAASESPKKRTLPAVKGSFIAPTVYRYTQVDAVLTVVDVLGAEAFKQGVTRFEDVFGRSAHADERAVFTAFVAEFRGYRYRQ